VVLFSVLYHLSIACLNKFCLLSTTNLASKTRWSFFEMCIGPIEMTMILPRLILAFSLRGRYIQVSYIYIYIKLRLYSFIKKKRLENWSSTPLDWEIHKFKNKLLICLLRALDLWSSDDLLAQGTVSGAEHPRFQVPLCMFMAGCEVTPNFLCNSCSFRFIGRFN
jgi:hypothetical protein